MKRCRPLLGTFVEIEADDSAAIDAAFVACERVQRLMSAHDPDSDVSRINRIGHLWPVEVDPWTAIVLERALFWSKESAGAFDIVQAGKHAIEAGNLPRHPDQREPEAGHWTWLEFDGHSARFLKPGCIDLGGIAKGFAIDRMVEALRSAGATRGLVNAGGDLRAFGRSAWPVSVVDPVTRLPLVNIDLENMALATSAGLPGVELSFDHLLGGEQNWFSITVRAGNACDADALTKILWRQQSGVAAMLERAGAEAFAVLPNRTVKPLELRIAA